ncbi:MAG: M20/M25/M40 family metallo-hydrolase, partial [Verrucomicrobiota bacterium]
LGAALQLLKPEGELSDLFNAYFNGEKVVGYPLEQKISAKVSLQKIEASGRNVIGRLVVGDEPSAEAIMIGGHIDHLGFGNRGGTRAKGEDTTKMHVGADDNASGVAAIMELAQHFTALKKAGELQLKRDLVFVGWSGEEMGLIGSRHYIQTAKESAEAETLYPAITAYINLDMVGRLNDRPLKLQGSGSSEEWAPILADLAEKHGLEIQESPSPFMPSDASPVYAAGVPVIAAFTGLHPDYHTPLDTPDKIDYEGLHVVSNYLADLVQQIANREDALAYTKFVRPNQNPKVSIGIAFEPVEEEGGIRVTEVVEDSPAAKAGVEAGDLLDELNGKKVNSRVTLLRVIADLNAEKEYPLVVKRGDENVNLTIKPVARVNR